MLLAEADRAVDIVLAEDSALPIPDAAVTLISVGLLGLQNILGNVSNCLRSNRHGTGVPRCNRWRSSDSL